MNKPKSKPCQRCKQPTIVVKKFSNIFKDIDGKNRPRWMWKCNRCGRCELGDFVEP